MACECPHCGAWIPWVRRAGGWAFWRSWNCACGARLRWEHAKHLVAALVLFIIGVTIAIANDRPLVGGAILIAGYVAIVVQNRAELVFKSGRCLRCGYQGVGQRCAECGWVDLQG